MAPLRAKLAETSRRFSDKLYLVGLAP